MPFTRRILRLLRPLQLFFAILTYLLGIGMAHYLGRPFRLAAFFLGLLAVLALQVAAFLLKEYFQLLYPLLDPGETPRQREQFRTLLLQATAAVMTLAAACAILLIFFHLLSIPAGILLLMMFLLLVSYAVPPLQLSRSGFGELVMAVHLATLLPAQAYLLQAGEYHRLLPMVTFPLTLLGLAYLLILDFPSFATDQKFARHSLLTRLTWQRAIPAHHFLILAAFLLYALAPFLGFPWGLIWPVFLALPFAGFQIFWLHRIARGGRTMWIFLTKLAAAVFGLTVYLLTLSFWVR